MRQNKLLSIVVPAYNMQDYLARCVDSVLSAGVESVEVIIVNDGSTDNTSAIAHSLERDNPGFVRVADKENGHYGSAVNVGLAAANGTYIKTLDADDTFDGSGLAALMSQISEDEAAGLGIDLYLTDFDAVDCVGRTRYSTIWSLPQEKLFGLEEVIAKKMEVVMQSCTWRTGLLKEIGYKQSEGIAYSDTEWILYPMLAAKQIRYVPRCVYRYLIGREGQSVSLEGRRRNFDSLAVLLLRILGTVRDRVGELGLPQKEYLFRVTTDVSRWFLEVMFFLKPMRQAKCDVMRLTADMEEAHPGLYARLEDEAVVMKRSLNIHYLKVWRILPLGKTFWIALMRMYITLTRWNKVVH